MNWQKVERFSSQKLTSESFDNDNKRTFKSFLAVWCVCVCVCFNKDQRRTDGTDFMTDTVSEFQNTPELKKAKTYSALSFDRTNFFNMANLFSLSRKPFVICCCFREPIKSLFFGRLSNDCQIERPALVSGPQTGRSHIINILLASFFRSVR